MYQIMWTVSFDLPDVPNKAYNCDKLYLCSWLNKLFTGRHVSLLGDIILLPCQYYSLWFEPTGDRTQDISTLIITPQRMYKYNLSQLYALLGT
jgi:hypothetical protein